MISLRRLAVAAWMLALPLWAADPLTIAVIPKGTTHEFWKSIHAGAVKAQRELEAAGTPVKLFWKGPLREDDRDQQIQVVENFTTRGVSGIVLAPLDAQALIAPVRAAKKAGIPTVVIDSALNSDVPASRRVCRVRRGLRALTRAGRRAGNSFKPLPKALVK